MSLLKIINIILLVILLIVGIETIIKFKKSENKLIEDIRKPLLIRIDIIIFLIIAIAILTLINIFSTKNIFGIENYDLAINVDKLGVEETAEMIKNIIISCDK